jgi:hypothetical protein
MRRLERSHRRPPSGRDRTAPRLMHLTDVCRQVQSGATDSLLGLDHRAGADLVSRNPGHVALAVVAAAAGPFR